MFLAVWKNWESISVGEAFLIALIAILIVFFVITIIVLSASLLEKGIKIVDTKTNILPKEENKILNEDEDAVVALLVATMDFYNETKKDAKVVSIKIIED